MAYVVRIQFKVRSLGRLTIHYLRDEYAPNTLADATQFDTLEQAENAADVARENSKDYAREWSAKFIEVK